ncbi:MAG: cell wall hydrolase [Clostridium sp.]|nr:cell wall hydrolase [Clostridium sp.]MCM1399734.1 cell wall hydrolase [Clostridium sp.]MCM1460431.1 cell wall hydrolase [Bacteroides sp.]
MNKRMKLKMHNLRLNLKKNVFNEKYFVRNTIAALVGVSAIGLSVCGANVLKDRKDVKAGMVAAAETEDTIEDTITIDTISLMNPSSVLNLKTAMDDGANMVVEANDFQVVANVQDDFELKGTELDVTPSASTTEIQVSEQPTTEATTTEAPTTEAPTTEAPATEAPTTEAPASQEPPAPTTRAAFNLTDYEVQLMACVLTLECGNQSYEGQLAVANLILNRLETGIWGNTIEGVLYAQNQFSVVYTDSFAQCMANGPQESCVTAVRDAASGNNNIGSYLSYRATYSVDTSAYPNSAIIGDHIFF